MSRRNPRNNPYPARGEVPAAGRTPSLVRAWRWRTEFALLITAVAVLALTVSATVNGSWWAAAAMTGAVSVPAATRFGRGWVSAHFWCLFSRHRIQRVCLETPMHTTSGRIPLVLWIAPTAEGERAFIVTRAGICAEDFEAFSGELEAACLARQVLVWRHRRRAALVAVEIVRRDGRAPAGTPAAAGLDGGHWVRVPSSRDTGPGLASPREIEEPPDPRRTLLIPQTG
ncbi:hypothetical protein [Spongiactinospora sp. 9N601]|uniref:hypothetical protein n=1 Tax=Spongiactinospora sp. 9N601 TaxID=3375149 RepID=UPI0037911E9E